MNHLLMRTIAVTILIISATVMAGAQRASGTVNGKVMDDKGAVIPGAIVSVTLQDGPTSPTVRTTTTDDEGNYAFSDLPFGTYEMRVRWTPFVHRDYRKVLKITSSKPKRINTIILGEPCAHEEGRIRKGGPSARDRAEIVKQLIDLTFYRPDSKWNLNMETIIMSDKNIRLDWVPDHQSSRILILPRAKIQEHAERAGEIQYFTVSKMTLRGGCVGVSMLNNLAVKGQFEDANMAGGGTLYEFRKINGRWEGTVLISWIS